MTARSALLAFLVLGAFGSTANASTIAISTGKVDTKGVTAGAAAPSAVCAGVEIGDSTFVPAPGDGRTTGSGVTGCSDTTQFQGKPFPILNAKDTAAVGAAVLKSFPPGTDSRYRVFVSANPPGCQDIVPLPDNCVLKFRNMTTKEAGEAFLYNRQINAGGKGPLNAAASMTSPSGSVASASATQSQVGTAFVGSATARYNRVRFEPIGGLAIAIVNDPLDLLPESLGTPGTVSVYIGDPDDPSSRLRLQASDPDEFAMATYTLALGDTTLLGLLIGITADTKSVSDATFIFTDFDASILGYSDPFTFLNNFLIPDLTWDPTTGTLSQIDPLLLNVRPIQIIDETILTYNYTAEAGSIGVSEPTSIILFLTGCAAFCGRKHFGLKRSQV
jgi:hypothetical protein